MGSIRRLLPIKLGLRELIRLLLPIKLGLRELIRRLLPITFYSWVRRVHFIE